MQRFNCKQYHSETIKLFTPTLNDLAVSDQSLHLPIEKTQETNKTEDGDNVFAVEHIHGNLVLSLRCSRVSKSIIYICYNAYR